MAPLGANLTFDQLLAALQWKLENENHNDSSFEIANFLELQRNGESTWSRWVLKLQYIINLLKQRLNALLPINHLPFEILEKIFLHLQNEYSNTSFHLPPAKSDLNFANSWIRVTHVCQRWRRCPHGAKALWHRITLGDKLKFPAFLATSFFMLSDPLPITLEHEFGPIFDSEDEQMNQFYVLLLEHPERISALYLRGRFPDMAWNLLRLSLPNIVDVELSFGPLNPTPFMYSRPVRDGNIENFLGGRPSSLRKLSLENYTWPRQTFPVLTHLYLTNEFYADMVFEDEFFQVLDSLSSTLQFLYLSSPGPIIMDPNDYTIRPTEERLIMPALKHLEIYPRPGYHSTNYLLHLYNLSLPKIETTIWDWRWTEDLHLRYQHPPNRSEMTMIPPVELLAKVASLIGCAARKGCYVLSGNMLSFDLRQAAFTELTVWSRLIPNVETLALPYIVLDDRMVDIRDVLRSYTNLKSLHLDHDDNLLPFLHCLEEEEDQLGKLHFGDAGVLPHFETLTIHTRRLDPQVLQERAELSDRLFEYGLQQLELSDDNSMTRVRRHSQSTYTLRFEAGGVATYFNNISR